MHFAFRGDDQRSKFRGSCAGSWDSYHSTHFNPMLVDSFVGGCFSFFIFDPALGQDLDHFSDNEESGLCDERKSSTNLTTVRCGCDNTLVHDCLVHRSTTSQASTQRLRAASQMQGDLMCPRSSSAFRYLFEDRRRYRGRPSGNGWQSPTPMGRTRGMWKRNPCDSR